ncbi:family 43 glycosylhydrolase [Photobacterium sagamiensis]|uniref:family 43 glycosylhydrolase n=1 Tax=Photobacterium sagamiensis TaxID=2910241 RepID=UPI003D0B6980
MDSNKTKTLLTLTIGALLSAPALATIPSIESDTDWFDTSGNLIEAHGGHMFENEGTYYWVGQDRSHNSNLFKGLNCYSSTNLADWKFENSILTPEKNPELDADKIVARPKVVFNQLTNSFVMWFKYRDPTGVAPNMKAGVASSTSPCGNYNVERTFYPEIDGVQHYTGDTTMLVDTDGEGYYVVSSIGELENGVPGTVVGGENLRRLKVFKLTPDFRDVEEFLYDFPVEVDKKSRREGPALMKTGDTYVLLSSGTTSWNTNQQKYSTAPSMSGPWSEWKNIGDEVGFGSQTAFIIPVNGSNEATFIYAADSNKGNVLVDSRYVWLPIKQNNGELKLDWMASWGISEATGEWYPSLDASLPTNTLFGTAIIDSCPSVSSGFTVNKLGTGGNNNGSLQINNLYVPRAGDYQLDVSYFSSEDREADISINGEYQSRSTFSASGAWCYDGGVPATKTITVNLNQGDNSITFSNSAGNAPVLDKVTLLP